MAQNRKPRQEAAPAKGNERDPSEEQIALLAYQYWQARGRFDGAADEDWFRAEADLKSRGSEGKRPTKSAASA